MSIKPSDVSSLMDFSWNIAERLASVLSSTAFTSSGDDDFILMKRRKSYFTSSSASFIPEAIFRNSEADNS